MTILEHIAYLADLHAQRRAARLARNRPRVAQLNQQIKRLATY